MTDLSEFELRDQDHTDLFGIFLGVHALPGAVLFLHTTVGCKFKTQMHLVDHDWFRESHNQRLWTGVDDARLIAGSGRRLVEFAQTWTERRRPALAVVATNAAVELSALDVEAAVEELRRRLPCPVLLLKAPGYGGGLHRGYRRLLQAVWPLLSWERPARDDHVALAGYLFDRYERDHAANLQEVRRLLQALDLRLSGVAFGGEPYDELRETLPLAGTVALLPLARGILPPGGRRVADVDLPVGLTGSAAFLRGVGKAAGVDPGRVEAVIDRETARAVPLIAHAARRLQGVRAGVFLDTAMAAAVTAFLLDMGLEVPFVALTDRDDADEGRFRAALSRLAPAGAPAPEVVLRGPSRNESLRRFLEVAAERPVPVAVGSAVQRLVLNRHLTFVVELGYPATQRHALYPMPFFGFNGAVALAQRVMDAAHTTF